MESIRSRRLVNILHSTMLVSLSALGENTTQCLSIADIVIAISHSLPLVKFFDIRELLYYEI
jgi:hypothetical protein